MIADNGPSESALRQRLSAAGLSVAGTRMILNRSHGYRELIFELRQWKLASDTTTPPIMADLAAETGVMKLRWDALQ